MVMIKVHHSVNFQQHLHYNKEDVTLSKNYMYNTQQWAKEEFIKK